MNNTYWKEKYADYHSRAESKIAEIEKENKKLKEELAEVNQLKDMYHTYYRAKHDDIKGIIFKQKEKLEKIKEVIKCSKEPMNCSNCPMCERCEELCVNGENFQNIILQIIEGVEDE